MIFLLKHDCLHSYSLPLCNTFHPHLTMEAGSGTRAGVVSLRTAALRLCSLHIHAGSIMNACYQSLLSHIRMATPSYALAHVYDVLLCESVIMHVIMYRVVLCGVITHVIAVLHSARGITYA